MNNSRASDKRYLRGVSWIGTGLLVLFWALMPRAVLAQPTGYQEYYVLGYEEHIWRVFLNIYEGPDKDIPGLICSAVSLVATADHQVVYYDHWEDGYEADLLNPIQSTTEVYGDGDLSNGGFGSDILVAGDDVNLTSDRNLTGPQEKNGFVPVDPVRDPTDIRYDGGDRLISSGGPVDLTHAIWPLNRSWIGGAWEVYSRQAYAEAYSYRLPIGEDLYVSGGGDEGAFGDFRNVYLQLEAFEDNTSVLIDNGVEAVNLTLDRGQTYVSIGHINSSLAPSIAVNAGTRIRSNKPTQVGLATGADSRGGDGFQGRFFIMLSDQLWGADYVLPIPSGRLDDQAEIYLANPNDFPISINAYDAEIQTTFVISPSTAVSATIPYSTKRGGLGYVPQDSAVRFTSPDGVFGVVVTADTSDIEYDWGFSGIPAKFLTRDYYVSWAPGTTDLSDNGSPVWVTPRTDSTTFFVDFSPLDGVVDETFTLDVLQQRRVFDPDNDNTGTHIWATSEFAMIWGEDPRRAAPSDPYLDLGVTTLPLSQRWLDPVLTLDKTVEPTILPSAGGTVTYTLVALGYNSPLTNVDFTDTLPLNWSYVPASTRVVYPDGSWGKPEPTRNGQTLFWDLSTALDVNESMTLTFQAQITQTGGVDHAAFDGFESGTYTGGANWDGGWVEQGDDGSSGSGRIRTVTSNGPFAGDWHLQIRSADNAILRRVNLATFIVPTLHFVRKVDQLESGDRFFLDVHDGTRWTTAMVWGDGDQEGKYVHEVVDLTPFASDATRIRFRSGSTVGGGDYFYADQIEIYEGIGKSVNRGQAVGQDEYSNTLFSPTDDATVYISPFGLYKSVSHTEAKIGETLAYTLSYANLSSAMPATNVSLYDAVPTQAATFQSASEGGTYDPSSGTVEWFLDTLAPGASGMVTFTVRVNNFVDDGTVLENVGFIKSDQTQAGSNLVRTIVKAPRLRFTKSGPNASAPGRVITYTLSYRNFGDGAATGVVISDDVPALTSYVAGSLEINTGSGWIPLSDAADEDQGAFIAPTVIITPGVRAGTIGPLESGEIRFKTRIRGDLEPGALILNAALLDRDLDQPRESNTVVTRIVNLLLLKAAEQAVVAPGDVISYTLTYKGTPDGTRHTDVYVLEQIPNLTNLLPASVFGADRVEYSWDNGHSWSATLPVTDVTHLRWYDEVLPRRAQSTVGFAVRVKPSLPPNTAISNLARVASNETGAYLGEWIPSNEVRVETVDLWVKKQVNHAAAWAGDTIAYTLLFGNHGSADAFDVRLLDELPPGVAYVPGSIWGEGADDSAVPTLAWEVPEVLAGASARVAGYAVVLDSDLSTGYVVTNTAFLESPFPTVTSNAATTTISGPSGPILTLNKQASEEIVAPGERFTYTLTVVNDGRVAQGLIVSDVVPDGTSFVNCAGAVCRLAGDTVVWGPLPLSGGGATLELTLAVQVDWDLPPDSTILNADYRLVVENADPLVGPPVTTTVKAPQLSLAKWAFRQEVYAGSRLDYGILVNNAGGRALRLVVSDTLPADTTFGGCGCTIAALADAPQSSEDSNACSLSFTCSLEGETVAWSVDDMAANRGLQMTFWVTADGSLADGSVLVNKHYAVSAENAPLLVGTVPVTTTVRRLNLSIMKAAWPNPVSVAEQLVYTITVRNDGRLLEDLTVTDVLPSGVVFVDCGGALCQYYHDIQRTVRWWLPNLPGGSQRELTLRVDPRDVLAEVLVNRRYGVWVPAAERRIMGPPVQVSVINPYRNRLLMPLIFRDFEQ